MELNKQTIIYFILIALVLLILLASFGIINFNKSVGNAASSEYFDMPEKCRPPAGEDEEKWKEHLSHHAETSDCLKYFE